VARSGSLKIAAGLLHNAAQKLLHNAAAWIAAKMG
jgi:hypothetical protein